MVIEIADNWQIMNASPAYQGTIHVTINGPAIFSDVTLQPFAIMLLTPVPQIGPLANCWRRMLFELQALENDIMAVEAFNALETSPLE